MSRESEKKEHRQRSVLPSLLLILALVFSLSTGMLGFVLGRNAVSGGGELIDTIVVSPDQGSGGVGVTEVTHFLSGRALYSSGDPCVGATIRLADSGISDETDENGKFFFSNIQGGSHTVEVLDEKGELLADTPVMMSFQQDGVIRADVTVPVFELPANTRMLELTLTVDPEEKLLAFRQEGGYVVTTDGTVADLSGNTVEAAGQDGYSEQVSYSVLPGGDVVSSEGYTLVSGDSSLVILPTGDLISADELTEEEQSESGMSSQEDGTVALTQLNTKVNSTGTVSNSQGNVGPSNYVISVTGSGAQELTDLSEGGGSGLEEASSQSSGEEDSSSESSTPEISETPQPSASSEESSDVSSASSDAATSSASSAPSESGGEEQEMNMLGVAGNGAATPAPTPTPLPTPTPSPTPVPTEEPLTMVGQSWTQESMIDLFAHQAGGTQDLGTVEVWNEETREYEDVPMIAPGSKGYYDFKLKNTSNNAIRFTLTLGEETFHLPILYSVRDLETNRLYQGGSKIGRDRSPITTGYITLPANSERNYRLGWEWQLEDWYSPEEDNEIDMAAAAQLTNQERTYIVSLGLNAEEVISLKTGGTTGNTRYPGKTKY